MTAMKKIIGIALMLIILLTLSASTVFAGEGDPTPGVEYNPWGVSCGVPAGEYGFFSTFDWWWAVYPNGGGVLKCVAHLNPGQTPPATILKIPVVGGCGTPGGFTSDAFTKVFPDGHIELICRK
jgi:hypothetical protein